VNFAQGSRGVLSPRDTGRFSTESLFDRVGRALCAADCLPRKELYESWEVARRTRRRFRGGRVVDLACGHGLLAHLMLLLDDSSPHAVAVDRRLPASAPKIANAMIAAWPRLAGRVTLQALGIDAVALVASDVVVSSHACGSLSDDVLTRALAVRARVAVLPCCHEKATCDTGGIEGWVESALAIDLTRAARLRSANYAIHTQMIPASITPKNRLLLGEPQ
jgi:SAM-dependent methyltransferase